MEDASVFHDGMRALQDEFDGRRVADALERRRKHRELWPGDIALIIKASFFFVAPHHGNAVDCSYKGRVPGFVQVMGPAAVARHHGAKSILRLAASSPHSPTPGATPPAPAWKSRDYLRDELPAGDPHGAAADPAPPESAA